MDNRLTTLVCCMIHRVYTNTWFVHAQGWCCARSGSTQVCHRKSDLNRPSLRLSVAWFPPARYMSACWLTLALKGSSCVIEQKTQKNCRCYTFLFQHIYSGRCTSGPLLWSRQRDLCCFSVAHRYCRYWYACAAHPPHRKTKTFVHIPVNLHTI